MQSRLQAKRKIQAVLQLPYVGQLTGWGYGTLCWILEKCYHGQDVARRFQPRFRILKGLPADLTSHERQLVMAALLHDLVDTDLHASKLGCPITIPEPYMQWLCEHHHTLKEHPTHFDLQLLQAADVRTSRYARLISILLSRRKLSPVNTSQIVQKLEQAAQCSVYKLYSVIYHSQALNRYVASKAHPTEILRNHLLGVANWVLFLLRTQPPTSVVLAGEPGGTPGPVEVEDPRAPDEP